MHLGEGSSAVCGGLRPFRTPHENGEPFGTRPSCPTTLDASQTWGAFVLWGAARNEAVKAQRSEGFAFSGVLWFGTRPSWGAGWTSFLGDGSLILRGRTGPGYEGRPTWWGRKDLNGERGELDNGGMDSVRSGQNCILEKWVDVAESCADGLSGLH
jgi:hypothetical protein